MSEKTTAEVWIAMDCNGDYAVGCDRDGAVETYESHISSSIAGVRLIHLNVSITAPEDTPVDVDVPDDAGTIVEAEVAENPEHAA